MAKSTRNTAKAKAAEAKKQEEAQTPVETKPEEVVVDEPKTESKDNTGKKEADKQPAKEPATKTTTKDPVKQDDKGVSDVQAEDETASETQVPEVEEVPEEVTEVEVEEEPTFDPETDGNYLSQPKAIRDAEASQEQIHVPTGTRIRPAMNPFMRMEEERNSKRRRSNVPTAADMQTKVEEELKLDVNKHFVLASIVGKLDNYVVSMAPNTPISEELGARLQVELSRCFTEALSAGPEASLEALRIIELYFTAYRNHSLSRTHVFRFSDVIRLEQSKLLGFHSLLHLFLELGNPGERSKREIQREVNIGKIADAISDNTDVQTRLVEFLNA